MSLPGRPRLLVCAVALAAVSACGTTVPGAASVAGSAGGSTQSGLGSATSPELAGRTDAAGTTVPGATSAGAVGAPSGAAVTQGAGALTSPGQATAATRASAVLVKGSGPVRVGVLYIDGADSVASTFGISGLSTGDAAAQSRAIVRYLNSKGGLHGRPIELHYGKMDGNALASNTEQTHAAACASLTEDQKVAYVVSYVQLTSNQLTCYTRRGVAVIDDQSSVPDEAGRRLARAFGSPGELALGRAATELVDALWRTGWLTAASKVGTFVYDTPDGVGLETKYLKPALARHGLSATSARTSSSADGANQNATVLKFRSAGVDRVIPLGANPLFLMNAAEAQGYRPAYAMTSTFGPGALLESAAPKAQLKNSAGIGWSKYLDIGSGTRPGPVSGNETLCFDIMTRSGQQSSSTTVQAFQVALCNVLMFLKAETDRFGVVANLLDQVRAASVVFPPADAFAIRMTPSRADGVSAYRDLIFRDDCTCYQYSGGNRLAP